MSDMKCPFCQRELKIAGEHTTIMSCFNGDCYGSGLYGEKAFWQELIRTHKALGVATGFIKGISQTVINDCDNQYVVLSNFKKFAQDTLEKITALEQKDEK